MFHIAAIAAVTLALASCASPPIQSGEFLPHARFQAEHCEDTAAARPAAAPAAARRGAKPPEVDHAAVARCRDEHRERAFAECRAQALTESNRVSTQPNYGGLAGAIGQGINARNTAILTIGACMDAKGYGWISPRR